MKRIINSIIITLLLSFFYPTYLIISPSEYALYPQLKQKYTWLDENIYKHINRNAEIYGLDVLLICSLIQAESRGQIYARSPVNARGLMQVMIYHKPAHSRIMDMYRPALNIALGCRYLSICRDDLPEQLRKYNAGYYSKRQYYNNWKYVNDIISDYNDSRRLYAGL